MQLRQRWTGGIESGPLICRLSKDGIFSRFAFIAVARETVALGTHPLYLVIAPSAVCVQVANCWESRRLHGGIECGQRGAFMTTEQADGTGPLGGHYESHT